MKRRIFLYWVSLGTMISVLFSRQSRSSSQINSQSEGQFYPVGSIDELQQQGYLLNEDLELGAVLVMLAEDNTVIAVDPTCTHAGCTVEWDSQTQALICPCHGSQFEQTGKLIDGLANFDLTRYQLKIEDNLILVGNIGTDKGNVNVHSEELDL